MRSGECHISRTLARKVLKQDLGRKPYKIPMYHQIKPGDYQKRVEFAEWFLRIPQAKSEYLIVSDEAYFYLTESLNRQNNRIWETERPTDGIEKPLHSEKILVFCAISATKIYGPYYFSTSVNQHNYLEMLKVWFWPKHLRTSEYKNIIFSKMGPLLIHLILFKSGWPRNLVKNSLLRVHGQHGHQTSTHVTTFYGDI